MRLLARTGTLELGGVESSRANVRCHAGESEDWVKVLVRHSRGVHFDSATDESVGRLLSRWHAPLF